MRAWTVSLVTRATPINYWKQLFVGLTGWGPDDEVTYRLGLLDASEREVAWRELKSEPKARRLRDDLEADLATNDLDTLLRKYRLRVT